MVDPETEIAQPQESWSLPYSMFLDGIPRFPIMILKIFSIQAARGSAVGPTAGDF